MTDDADRENEGDLV
ncbi:MAG: hypothetical protein ABR589_02085, partial [Chthoniobacterales bacterium]